MRFGNSNFESFYFEVYGILCEDFFRPEELPETFISDVRELYEKGESPEGAASRLEWNYTS